MNSIDVSYEYGNIREHITMLQARINSIHVCYKYGQKHS
jgi:hypothetical protein